MVPARHRGRDPVRYYVRFEPHVKAYVGAIKGLSVADRAAVIDGVIDVLGRSADLYLARYPLGHESLHFGFDYVQAGGGALYIFDFTVDGTHMASGVVTVVYAECEIHRPS